MVLESLTSVHPNFFDPEPNAVYVADEALKDGYLAAFRIRLLVYCCPSPIRALLFWLLQVDTLFYESVPISKIIWSTLNVVYAATHLRYASTSGALITAIMGDQLLSNVLPTLKLLWQEDSIESPRRRMDILFLFGGFHFFFFFMLLMTRSLETLIHISLDKDFTFLPLAAELGAFIILSGANVIMSTHHWKAGLGVLAMKGNFDTLEFFAKTINATLALLSRVEDGVIYHVGMRESSPEYQYDRRLRLGSNKMRLLILEKRKLFRAPHCRMVTVKLNAGTAYDACSYVWGDPYPGRRIILDGRALRVNDSAYSILQRRQSFLYERILWIDAICINQRDLVEKLSQIGNMRTIYQSATCVRAFLRSSRRPCRLSRMLNTFSSCEGFADSYGRRLGALVDAGTPDKYLPFFKEWQDFVRLIESEYFQRMWILQEAVLAENFVFHFGEEIIPWNLIYGTVKYMTNGHLLFIILLKSKLVKKSTMRGIIRVCLFAGIRDEFREIGEMRLQHLLESCILLRSRQPQDKILGVLGLVPSEAFHEIVGVGASSHTVRDVFVRTMHYVLRKDTHRSALATAGLEYETGDLNLPSWVSNWANDRVSKRALHQLRLAASCETSPEEPMKTRDSGYVLEIRTRRRGKVSRVTSALKGDDQEPYVYGRAHFRICGFLQEAWNLFLEVNDGRHWTTESFWRTLIQDTDLEGHRPASAEYARMYDWFAQWFDVEGKYPEAPCFMALRHPEKLKETRFTDKVIEAHTKDIEGFSKLVAATLEGKSFGILESGDLGLFPSIVMPDDDVFDIMGVCCTCILRPSTEPGHIESDVVLVGTCHITEQEGQVARDGPWEDYRIH